MTKELQTRICDLCPPLAKVVSVISDYRGRSFDTDTDEMRLLSAYLQEAKSLLEMSHYLLKPARVEAPTTPAPPARQESAKPERKSASGAKRVLAMDLETGITMHFPSMAATCKAIPNLSGAAVAKTLSATSAEDWRRGEEFLEHTPSRHAKNWAFVYEDRLEQ